jgi:hypothetical protein
LFIKLVEGEKRGRGVWKWGEDGVVLLEGIMKVVIQENSMARQA